MPEIVPRKEALGTGVFRKSNGDYIIRSDLGCYLRTQFLETGQSAEIRDLHPSCRDGEHYLGSERDPNIYIIKGDSYRVVQDLSTDQEAKVYELHPNCRGGDHYMKCCNFFLILFCERGVMRGVGDLSTDYEGEDVPLHPQCRLGLYYFGIGNFRAFIKMDEIWGTQFYLYKNMTTATLATVYSIHPSVLNFLTGGLALTNGSSSGSWHCIKTLSNDSDVPVSWTHMITRKVGFAKEKVSSIERNWQVCTSAALKAGDLTAAIVKAQLALSGQYGGSKVKTEQEDWTEAREEEETLQATLQPKQNLYVWQYRLSLGPEPVLFCRDIKFTRDPAPPTTNPLPSCS